MLICSKFHCLLIYGSSGGVVVKLLACGARGPGSIPGLAPTTSEIGCLLLPCRDTAEIKRSKPSKQQSLLIYDIQDFQFSIHDVLRLVTVYHN